jgi:hypothetical protein
MLAETRVALSSAAQPGAPENIVKPLRAHDESSSSKAFASFRSSVSKPSVNQP